MKKEDIRKIVRQVIFNPQVTEPAVSYKITDVSIDGNYESSYIDVEDFEHYKNRLCEQLISRLS